MSTEMPDPEELPDEIIRFARIRLELEYQSDRGAAIIAGAFVELALENAIKEIMVNRKIRRDETLFDRMFSGAYAPCGKPACSTRLLNDVRPIRQLLDLRIHL